MVSGLLLLWALPRPRTLERCLFVRCSLSVCLSVRPSLCVCVCVSLSALHRSDISFICSQLSVDYVGAVFQVCWEGLFGGGVEGGSDSHGGRKARMGDFLLAQWGSAVLDQPTLSDFTFLCLHFYAVTHKHTCVRALRNRCGPPGGGEGGGQAASSLMSLL